MASLKINGRDYEIPTSFTLGERADMEKITGQGYDMEAGGALALLAVIAVCVRRVDPSITLDELRALPDDDLIAIGEELARQKAEEEKTARPPDGTPSGSGDAERSSSDGSRSGSEASRALTLAGSGDPTSDTGADSALAISAI